MVKKAVSVAGKKENKLTAKQEIFCKEYLVDLNATQAAIRAGYSEKTAKEIGCENLTKPNIQEYIQVLADERSKRVQIDADYVLLGIKEVTEECRQEADRSNAFKGYELLGKHLRLFTDKIDADIKGDLTFNINKNIHSARDNDK